MRKARAGGGGTGKFVVLLMQSTGSNLMSRQFSIKFAFCDRDSAALGTKKAHSGRSRSHKIKRKWTGQSSRVPEIDLLSSSVPLRE